VNWDTVIISMKPTLAIESVYLFTDIQDLVLIYCYYLWCDIECGCVI